MEEDDPTLHAWTMRVEPEYYKVSKHTLEPDKYPRNASYHNCRRCLRLQALYVHNIYKSLQPPFPPPLPTPLILLLSLLRRHGSNATRHLNTYAYSSQGGDDAHSFRRRRGQIYVLSLQCTSSSLFCSFFLCHFCPLISHLISLSGRLGWFGKLGYPRYVYRA